jgi:hypothetical protein
VSDVHGGTLHFGEGETHLHVDVVHVLQEIGEVSASCSDRHIVTVKMYRDKQDSGESNGNLPLRICPGCSVPEPYQSPDWALAPALPA